MGRWIASFGESYNDDVLQLAKQLFSVRVSINDQILCHEGV